MNWAVAAGIGDIGVRGVVEHRAVASSVAEWFQRLGDCSVDEPWPSGHERALAERLLHAAEFVGLDLFVLSPAASNQPLVRAAVGYFRRLDRILEHDGLGDWQDHYFVGTVLPSRLHAKGLLRPRPAAVP